MAHVRARHRQMPLINLFSIYTIFDLNRYASAQAVFVDFVVLQSSPSNSNCWFNEIEWNKLQTRNVRKIRSSVVLFSFRRRSMRIEHSANGEDQYVSCIKVYKQINECVRGEPEFCAQLTQLRFSTGTRLQASHHTNGCDVHASCERANVRRDRTTYDNSSNLNSKRQFNGKSHKIHAIKFTMDYWQTQLAKALFKRFLLPITLCMLCILPMISSII